MFSLPICLPFHLFLSLFFSLSISLCASIDLQYFSDRLSLSSSFLIDYISLFLDLTLIFCDLHVVFLSSFISITLCFILNFFYLSLLLFLVLFLLLFLLYLPLPFSFYASPLSLRYLAALRAFCASPSCGHLGLLPYLCAQSWPAPPAPSPLPRQPFGAGHSPLTKLPQMLFPACFKLLKLRRPQSSKSGKTNKRPWPTSTPLLPSPPPLPLFIAPWGSHKSCLAPGKILSVAAFLPFARCQFPFPFRHFVFSHFCL